MKSLCKPGIVEAYGMSTQDECNNVQYSIIEFLGDIFHWFFCLKKNLITPPEVHIL